ncbi:MAG: 2-succinyl-6-hydroxy-2,4-cyclohexadiene-carboxylate synthase [Solirubrobacteraceae bacterium]|nr:2-succinyl-6-hydroxy-2,4-cyclohexadiene-carboxylate synthase [Solirubrobacteraceae bacterium]
MPTAVVALHGFTNTGRSWDGVAAHLDRARPFLAPDLRGHGEASAARPITPELCAEDVAALAPDRFALAAYSMGARVALRVALAHPGRVESLVLIGATPGIADPVERAARAEEDAELATRIEASTIEAFADRWARGPLFKGQAPEVAETARADRLRNAPSGLAAALRGLGQGACEPLWGRLEELRMPVTLIVGERDAKYRKVAERMAVSLPRCDLVPVPATRHAVHLEAPAIVAAAIERAATLPARAG